MTTIPLRDALVLAASNDGFRTAIGQLHDYLVESLGSTGGSATPQTAVLLPNGALATPALRFASDADTGIYRVGENSMALVVGGVAVAVLKANQVIDLAGGYYDNKIFATRAAFLAAIIPTEVIRVGFLFAGLVYFVVRDAAGLIVQTDLTKWSADGVPSPEHYGFNSSGEISLTTADPWKAVLEAAPGNNKVFRFQSGTFVSATPLTLSRGFIDIRGVDYATRPVFNFNIVANGAEINMTDIGGLPVAGTPWFQKKGGFAIFDSVVVDGSTHNERLFVTNDCGLLIAANGANDTVLTMGPNVGMGLDCDGGRVKLSAAAGVGRIKFNCNFTANNHTAVYLTQCPLHMNNTDFTGTGSRFGIAINATRGSKVEGADAVAGSVTFTNFDKAMITQGIAEFDGRYVTFTGNRWPLQQVAPSLVSFGDGVTFSGNDVNGIVRNEPFGDTTMVGNLQAPNAVSLASAPIGASWGQELVVTAAGNPINLPAAQGNGYQIRIVNRSGGAITLTPAAGNTCEIATLENGAEAVLRDVPAGSFTIIATVL